jgi:hypothetical protein
MRLTSGGWKIMEWMPELLNLVVRGLQICAGLMLAYGAYFAILQISVPLLSDGTASRVPLKARLWPQDDAASQEN